MPRATITVRVAGRTLVKSVVGAAVTEGPSAHKVKEFTEVAWKSPDGALKIDFDPPTSPFVTGVLTLSAPQGQSTGHQQTKVDRKKRFHYCAEVTPPGQNPIDRDPDLIVDDSIGPLEPKKRSKGQTPKSGGRKQKKPKK